MGNTRLFPPDSTEEKVHLQNVSGNIPQPHQEEQRDTTKEDLTGMVAQK